MCKTISFLLSIGHIAAVETWLFGLKKIITITSYTYYKNTRVYGHVTTREANVSLKKDQTTMSKQILFFFKDYLRNGDEKKKKKGA